MDYILKIMSVEDEPNGIKKFIVNRPRDFKFSPGQSIYISINKPGLEEQKKLVTFFSLNSDFYIEMLFKEDPAKADNKQFFDVKAGEELILSDIVGELSYKGKGVFIGAGKGGFPFLNIFKHLKSMDSLNGNTFIYFARDSYEVYYERILKHLLGNNFTVILGKDNLNSLEVRKLDESTIKQKVSSLNQEFYISGPRYFVNHCNTILDNLGIKAQTQILE